MVILAPRDQADFVAMLDWAMAPHGFPISIRYPKGSVHLPEFLLPKPIALGKAQEMFASHEDVREWDVVVLSIGSMVWPSVGAVRSLMEPFPDKKVCLVDLRFAKPLDMALLARLLPHTKHVVVIEEGVQIGGVYAYMMVTCAELLSIPVSHCHAIGIADVFVEHGKVSSQKKWVGLDQASLVARLKSIYEQ